MPGDDERALIHHGGDVLEWRVVGDRSSEKALTKILSI
jgi:hypothetical protein